MITLITGAPGAGKTAALVLLLMEVLGASGRQVFVHGILDLKIPHEDLTQPDTWPSTVPDGAIVIIDEVQDVWRPRGPGQKVPDHVQALETHRHRGLDFYIITQGPNLVDSNVRALVGRHIHLRDIGFLGRWWYEWPECADNCRTSWKNAPIKKRYKLPKQIFGQYKSASLHVKPIRSFPKMFVVAILAIVVALFMSYRFYSSMASKLAPAPTAVHAVFTPGQAGATSTAVKTAPDERKDFNARFPGRPWTAPAYDVLRVVVALPTITGGACFKGVCKCYHHDRVIPTVSSAECVAWIKEPPFNPYIADPLPPVSSPPVVTAQPPVVEAPAAPVALPNAAPLSPLPSLVPSGKLALAR